MTSFSSPKSACLLWLWGGEAGGRRGRAAFGKQLIKAQEGADPLMGGPAQRNHQTRGQRCAQQDAQGKKIICRFNAIPIESQRDRYCVIPLIRGPREVTFTGTEVKRVGGYQKKHI